MSSLPLPAADPVDLVTHLSPEGEVDAVLAVRWCVPRVSVDAIKALQAEDVHILLIARQGARERRWLYPVEREMAYVQFDRPGDWHLDATLVWNTSANRRELRELVKPGGETGYGGYTVTLYDHHGHRPSSAPWWHSQGTGTISPGNVALARPTSLGVSVPARFFAAPPPRALAWFANLHFGSQPVDQCGLRRRCIFNSLLSLIFAALLAGVVWLGVLLAPPVAGAVLAAARAVGGFFGAQWLWVGIAVGGALALCLLGLFAITIPDQLGWLRRTAPLRALGAWWRNQNAAADARFKARKQAEREALRRHHFELLDAMACEDRSREPRLGALDPSRRSIALRFRALKARVCRPYAAR